jgi:hypothetical protein
MRVLLAGAVAVAVWCATIAAAEDSSGDGDSVNLALDVLKQEIAETQRLRQVLEQRIKALTALHDAILPKCEVGTCNPPRFGAEVSHRIETLLQTLRTSDASVPRALHTGPAEMPKSFSDMFLSRGGSAFPGTVAAMLLPLRLSSSAVYPSSPRRQAVLEAASASHVIVIVDSSGLVRVLDAQGQQVGAYDHWTDAAANDKPVVVKAALGGDEAPVLVMGSDTGMVFGFELSLYSNGRRIAGRYTPRPSPTESSPLNQRVHPDAGSTVGMSVVVNLSFEFSLANITFAHLSEASAAALSEHPQFLPWRLAVEGRAAEAVVTAEGESDVDVPCFWLRPRRVPLLTSAEVYRAQGHTQVALGDSWGVILMVGPRGVVDRVLLPTVETSGQVDDSVDLTPAEVRDADIPRSSRLLVRDWLRYWTLLDPSPSQAGGGVCSSVPRMDWLGALAGAERSSAVTALHRHGAYLAVARGSRVSMITAAHAQEIGGICEVPGPVEELLSPARTIVSLAYDRGESKYLWAGTRAGELVLFDTRSPIRNLHQSSASSSLLRCRLVRKLSLDEDGPASVSSVRGYLLASAPGGVFLFNTSTVSFSGPVLVTSQKNSSVAVVSSEMIEAGARGSGDTIAVWTTREQGALMTTHVSSVILPAPAPPTSYDVSWFRVPVIGFGVVAFLVFSACRRKDGKGTHIWNVLEMVGETTGMSSLWRSGQSRAESMYSVRGLSMDQKDELTRLIEQAQRGDAFPSFETAGGGFRAPPARGTPRESWGERHDAIPSRESWGEQHGADDYHERFAGLHPAPPRAETWEDEGAGVGWLPEDDEAFDEAGDLYE